jgi:hypothetical protein
VTELLLCGHHFRASQDALRAAAVTVHDEEGRMIMGPGCTGQPPAWFIGAAPADPELILAQPAAGAGH